MFILPIKMNKLAPLILVFAFIAAVGGLVPVFTKPPMQRQLDAIQHEQDSTQKDWREAIAKVNEAASDIKAQRIEEEKQYNLKVARLNSKIDNMNRFCDTVMGYVIGKK